MWAGPRDGPFIHHFLIQFFCWKYWGFWEKIFFFFCGASKTHQNSRSWCTGRFTSCAEPGAFTASARLGYLARGLPSSGWPLHRLRTACAQSHFGVLCINRTKSLFFITKKSISSAKSPGFIIFWRTLECSPVIKNRLRALFYNFHPLK